jgi:tetratricopeptide (TPR) repeat protein
MEPGGRSARWRSKLLWTGIGLVLAIVTLAGLAVALRARQVRPGRAPRRLDLLYAAWTEFNAKRYDQASAILDRRAANVSATALDWMLRGRIAESQGLPDEAIGHLKKIADTDALSAQAWLRIGQIEHTRHLARAAEAAYRRAERLDPNQVQPRRELAYLYALQRRQAECDSEFRALSRLIPLDHVLTFAWCQNYCRLWDPNESRKVLKAFLTEDPDDRFSRLALATSFQLTNQLDSAVEVLRAFPNSDPDARALRTQFAIERGEIEAAEILAREGPADHARLNVLRGQLALHAGQTRNAVAFFQAALRKESEDRDALQGLGLAMQTLADPQASKYLDLAARHDVLRRTIRDSVTTFHSDPRLFFKLGELCESLNHLDEARAWYRLAIGRDPLDTQAQQGLTRVNQTVPSENGPIPMPDK